MDSLPTNVDAERLILGAVLLDDTLYQSAAGMAVDDWALEKHRRIFRRMGDIAKRGERIDRITLANELMKAGELESVDGLSYIVGLDDGLPATPNIDSYVRIVQDKATLRRIVFAADKLRNRAMLQDAEPAELLRDASGQFLALAETDRDDALQTPYEIIAEEIARNGVDAFFGGGVKGIQTPIAWLNETIIGLKPGDLILIGARPSVGKTALMMQMAYGAAKAGHGTVVFSLEMGKLPLSMRIACSIANVDSQLYLAGALDRDERERLMGAIAGMEGLPLWIDKACHTVPEMAQKIRRQRTRANVDVAFIDYIQLMSGDGENANARVTGISRGLKVDLAEAFSVPVVALSQFSRPPKGTNPEPTLCDLRDSGSLEQDADVVLFLHSVDGKNGNGPRRLIVAKQRNGPVGATSLAFVGKYQRFEPLTTVEEPEY